MVRLVTAALLVALYTACTWGASLTELPRVGQLALLALACLLGAVREMIPGTGAESPQKKWWGITPDHTGILFKKAVSANCCPVLGAQLLLKKNHS
jgi:hypothetical protein